MKSGLVLLGIIFLVMGGLFYFVPFQAIQTGVDSTTSSVNVTVPVSWAYASAIIGFLLLIFGLAGSNQIKVVQGPRGPSGRNYSRRLPRGTIVTTTTRRTNSRRLPRPTSVTTVTTKTR